MNVYLMHLSEYEILMLKYSMNNKAENDNDNIIMISDNNIYDNNDDNENNDANDNEDYDDTTSNDNNNNSNTK